MARTKRILLYGATGFSGGLIAQEAARQRKLPAADFELVLASRDKETLGRLGRRLGLQWQAFSLDDPHRVLDVVKGFDVLVNAAGPFDQTAERLAKSCIRAGCHYVDINGEVDVYKRLDDLDYLAEQRGVVLVAGAGHTPALSDFMLDAALDRLQAARAANGAAQDPIATVRIAVQRMKFMSRGSVRTMMRMVREQVTVARTRMVDGRMQLALSHVPVGKLERSFDFGEKGAGGLRIASAANLTDTLTARYTALRHTCTVGNVESYIEMPQAARDAYQLGAITAFSLQLPLLQQLARWQVDLLPEGPDAGERAHNRHRVVLEIENRYREKVIDWCLQTGDPYELTARIALAVARKVGDAAGVVGWQTPAAILQPLRTGAVEPPLVGCSWLRHS